MKRVDVVYAYIQNEKSEILVVKNKRETGFDYTLPGGAVEAGETLLEALVREVQEETGMQVKPGGILSVNEVFFAKKGHHVLFFTFSASVEGGKLGIKYPDEIVEVRWMTVEAANVVVKNFGEGLKSYIDREQPAYFNRGTI